MKMKVVFSHFPGLIALFCAMRLCFAGDFSMHELNLSHSDGLYAKGEEIVVTGTLLKAGEAAPGCTLRVVTTWESAKVLSTQDFPCDGNPFRVSCRSDIPGWVYFKFQVIGPDGQVVQAPGAKSPQGKKELVDEIGAIVALEDIRIADKEPVDFDEFWRNERARLDTVPMNPRLEALDSGCEGISLYAVKLDAGVSRPVTGYLAVPVWAKPKTLPIFLSFLDGVNGDTYRSWAVSTASRGAAAFITTWHGFDVNREQKYYVENCATIQPWKTIGSRDTFYTREIYVRALRAADYLKTRPEWNGRDFLVGGASLAGAQAAAVAALDSDVTIAFIHSPGQCGYNGDLAGRRCGGTFSGLSPALKTPEARHAVAYCEVGHLARRIRCECYFCTGFADENCMPSHVLAAYNNVPATVRKTLCTNPRTGHYGTTRDVLAECRQTAFFRDYWRAHAGDLPAADDFRPVESDGEQGAPLSLGFEKDLPPEFRLAKGYQCGAGLGENGSGGLRLQRGPGEEYVFSWMPVVGLKEGRTYRFKASVKLTGIRLPDGSPVADGEIETIGFDFHDRHGKYVRSRYFPVHVVNGGCDWIHLDESFAMESVEARLVFFLKDLSCQSCQWDNVSIEQEDQNAAVIYPVLPKMLRLDATGAVRMRTLLEGDARDEEFFVLFARLPDGREFRSTIQDGFSEFRLGELPEGVTDVQFVLGDRRTMRIAAEVVYPFHRTVAVMGEGAVRLDESGRMSIDGKPFFPVGMFWENVSMTRQDFDRMKAMGVNCVLPYLSYRFRLPEATAPDNTSLADIRRSMDILHENGFKLIFCLLDVYGHHGDVRRFEDAEEMDDILRVTVNGLKDHPALLAWYISDENPLSDLPMLLRMREMINELDPCHPVVTLTYVLEHFGRFAPTGDVFMADCYPVHDETTQSMAKIRSCLQTANQDARIGLWWCQQIFNWGIYECPHHPEQPYSATRYPTEEEMRSHNLLALNNRARAVIAYAYNSIAAQEAYDPGCSQHCWAAIANVLKLTRELEPFYMADEVPRVLCRQAVGQSVVEACRHVANDGRRIVVVTSDGPGEVRTVIDVGAAGLTSRFGHCRELGGGRYEFSAVNTASDILE